MFKKTKRRIDSAFAKGLMFGKAVGARDERERIIQVIREWQFPVNQGTYTVEQSKQELIFKVIVKND